MTPPPRMFTPQGSEVQWMARVREHWRAVLYVWDALTFSPDSGVLPGLMAWATLHGAIVYVTLPVSSGWYGSLPT